MIGRSLTYWRLRKNSLSNTLHQGPTKSHDNNFRFQRVRWIYRVAAGIGNSYFSQTYFSSANDYPRRFINVWLSFISEKAFIKQLITSTLISLHNECAPQLYYLWYYMVLASMLRCVYVFDSLLYYQFFFCGMCLRFIILCMYIFFTHFACIRDYFRNK